MRKIRSDLGKPRPHLWKKPPARGSRSLAELRLALAAAECEVAAAELQRAMAERALMRALGRREAASS